MNLRDQLPALAAMAEVHGEAAMAAGNDTLACRMFRIQENADALFLALVEDDFTDRLVTELMRGGA